jgi:hypothetical protein
MPLIGLAVVLALGLPFAPLAVEAPPAAKMPRVGYLSMLSYSDSAFVPLRNAFREGLCEHGYMPRPTARRPSPQGPAAPPQRPDLRLEGAPLAFELLPALAMLQLRPGLELLAGSLVVSPMEGSHGTAQSRRSGARPAMSAVSSRGSTGLAMCV